MLIKVDPAELLRLAARRSFTGQVTGLLGGSRDCVGVLAHHSFHVFVVYPWVRFLDRDAATALGVMQDCRIRWGTVESVDGEHVVIASRPLTLRDGALSSANARPERVRWSKGDLSLIAAPVPGNTIAPRTGTGYAGLSPILNELHSPTPPKRPSTW